MPISMMSAPAFGSALTMSSEVFGSGSPAIRKVTSAARPSRLSSANRASMRVVICASPRNLRPRRHPHPDPPPQAGEGAHLAEWMEQCMPRTRSIPSPACGGGLGWGLSERTRCQLRSLLLPALQDFRDLRNVLVTAAGEIDDHQMIFRPLWRELHHLGDRMGGFQSRRNALQP